MKLLAVVLLVLAPVLANCEISQKLAKHSLLVDCSEHQRDSRGPSGTYIIHATGSFSTVKVYCDMESAGGGWTVFQRRMDGTVNFYRPWYQYKNGFGNAGGEYWLGLENLHQLTRRRTYELLVDMEDFQGNKAFARYASFYVGPESDGYRLRVSGFTNGGAGDALTVHSGHKFSTFDKDQDTWGDNCARKFLAAFWYEKCHYANPNGVYHWGADSRHYALGVNWYQWKGHHYSLKKISMKIRPVQ